MPTAESKSATTPKPSVSSTGARRLTSECSTSSSIVCTSKSGSSRSSDAITPRSDVASDASRVFVFTAKLTRREASCAIGKK